MNCTRLRSAILAAAMFAATGFSASADSWKVKDAAGKSVEIADTSKIITIGGAVTEIVYALGLGDRVVAVDITSTYPEKIKNLPSIGYMRALAPEGVLSLAPSLVLAIEGSGPPDAIEVLSRARIPFVLVPDRHDEEGVLNKIRFVAQTLGVPEKGEELAKAVAEDIATAKKLLAEKVTKRRKAVFVLSTGNGTPLVAGKHTSVQGIFDLAHVDNAITGTNGFKPATPESLLAAQPQAIVMLLERSLAVNADGIFAMPAFSATPAAKEKRLVSISSYFLSFGPRTAHAMVDLAAKIYPELDLPKLPPRPWTEGSSTHAK